MTTPNVEIPLPLWEEILDFLQDYEVCKYLGGSQLLDKIRSILEPGDFHDVQ